MTITAIFQFVSDVFSESIYTFFIRLSILQLLTIQITSNLLLKYRRPKLLLNVFLVLSVLIVFYQYQVVWSHSEDRLSSNIEPTAYDMGPENNWGWQPKCLPQARPKWQGLIAPHPIDNNATELPIPFWSAIAYYKHSSLKVAVVGPAYSSEGARKFSAKNRPDFRLFNFSCYFPITNTNVRGVFESDPHGNIALFNCDVPENEPIALGTAEVVEMYVHDWTHSAFTRLYACLPPISKQKFNVTAVATTRNVGCHLEEWLESLFLLGFDHVFIYDHYNEDNTTFSVLPRYIQQGLVTVFPWRMSKDIIWGGEFGKSQIMVYVDALYRFQSKWMFVGDVDEFPWLVEVMTPPDTPNPLRLPISTPAAPVELKPVPLPPVPKFKTPPTREKSQEALHRYLANHDNDEVGAVEIKQFLFGTGPGVPSQPSCLNEGEIKMIKQVYRHVDQAERPNQSKKYFARRDSCQIASIHEISKGGRIVSVPTSEMRMHHYWRGSRAAHPNQNQVLDVSSFAWGEEVAKRIRERRAGTLVGFQ